MALTINWRLAGTGWAECAISDGEQSCKVTASYLSDAFGDLVLAAVALLRHFTGLSFSFEEEPGEYRWVVTPTRANEVELTILGFDDFYDSKPNSEAKVLFRTVCIPEAFATAVHQAASRLAAEYGNAQYLEKWDHPFPSEYLKELSQRLGLTVTSNPLVQPAGQRPPVAE
jgi:hypothetical protein